MSRAQRKANEKKVKHPLLSRQEREKRKQRVLTKRSPSIVRSIADAIVVKDEELYFLSERNGRVPLGNTHGFGLYYHDCRYLNGYEVSLAGAEMSPLAATAARGYMAILELTNPDFHASDGRLVEKEEVGITWRRTIDSGRRMLQDRIAFRNFGPAEVSFPLTLSFQAEFEDIFSVRGLLPEQPGRLHPPFWKRGLLQFVYDGNDNLRRSVVIRFSLTPEKKEGAAATFRLKLQPEEKQELFVSVAVIESARESDLDPD
ncbi:MAG TPA: glycogen debranching N-terminal domain-containing protein, partial [Candidatus Manganitrophaceae bacterium]|nr:glycogen debranching N-terminal domain-containing protein [Candidatus Manganitrophaceae bacterium]